MLPEEVQVPPWALPSLWRKLSYKLSYNSCYSLSNSSLAIAFTIVLWQNLANHFGAPLRVGTNILLSQLRKMLILLIRYHCKMCPLQTIRSRVFVLFATDKHSRSYCRQWAHFTTGTNVQNRYFAVLRQNVSLYIHVVVLQSVLPSLDGKLDRFVTKKWKRRLSNSSQTDYSAHSGDSCIHCRKELNYMAGYLVRSTRACCS